MKFFKCHWWVFGSNGSTNFFKIIAQPIKNIEDNFIFTKRIAHESKIINNDFDSCMYLAMDWEPFVVFIRILHKLSILVRDRFAKVVSSFYHASWEVVAEEISGATTHVTDARMAWRMKWSCRFHNLHSRLEIGVVELDCRMVLGGQGVVPLKKPSKSYPNRRLVN